MSDGQLYEGTYSHTNVMSYGYCFVQIRGGVIRQERYIEVGERYLRQAPPEDGRGDQDDQDGRVGVVVDDNISEGGVVDDNVSEGGVVDGQVAEGGIVDDNIGGGNYNIMDDPENYAPSDASTGTQEQPHRNPVRARRQPVRYVDSDYFNPPPVPARRSTVRRGQATGTQPRNVRQRLEEGQDGGVVGMVSDDEEEFVDHGQDAPDDEVAIVDHSIVAQMRAAARMNIDSLNFNQMVDRFGNGRENVTGVTVLNAQNVLLSLCVMCKGFLYHLSN